METISVFNPHQWADAAGNIDVGVRWQRREYGGWTLVQARSGRVLGWIVRNSDDPRAWDVRLAAQAFRGDKDSDGDILDKVPIYLFNGKDAYSSNCVSTQRTKRDAAYTIISKLVNRRAPAVGFDRHPEVDTWMSDRHRQIMEATK